MDSQARVQGLPGGGVVSASPGRGALAAHRPWAQSAEPSPPWALSTALLRLERKSISNDSNAIDCNLALAEENMNAVMGSVNTGEPRVCLAPQGREEVWGRGWSRTTTTSSCGGVGVFHRNSEELWAEGRVVEATPGAHTPCMFSAGEGSLSRGSGLLRGFLGTELRPAG